jgi:hypothetical protein
MGWGMAWPQWLALYLSASTARLGSGTPVALTRPRPCHVQRITTMREVILSGSGPTGPISTQQSGSLLFHDILNGSSLASFKQTNASKNCTAIINSTGAQGGLMLAVQPDKSLLNVYSFQKVLLHIQDPTSVTSLTFPVLRIKYPSRSSSQNDYPALQWTGEVSSAQLALPKAGYTSGRSVHVHILEYMRARSHSHTISIS